MEAAVFLPPGNGSVWAPEIPDVLRSRVADGIMIFQILMNILTELTHFTVCSFVWFGLVSSPSSPASVPLIVTNFKPMQCLLQPALNSLPVNYSMEPNAAQFHIQSQACYCNWWAFGFRLKCKQSLPNLLYHKSPGSDFPHIRGLPCRWQIAITILTVSIQRMHGVATLSLGLQWILWVWLDGVLACWVFRTRTCQVLVAERAVCVWIMCLCAVEGCAERD